MSDNPVNKLFLEHDTMTSTELDECVQRDPRAALVLAWRELSDDQIANCARRPPAAAIAFAAHRLAREVLDECVSLSPSVALEFIADRLTPTQYGRCLSAAPRTAKKLLRQGRLWQPLANPTTDTNPIRVNVWHDSVIEPIPGRQPQYSPP